MKLAECNVRDKLATFNQLNIFLYALAAGYAPLFEGLFDYLQPRMSPYRAELKLSGSQPKHVKPTSKWSLKLVSATKYFRTGVSHKKWQFLLDYQCEFPDDFTCCGPGLRRLIISGGMKFFHVDARPLGESYLVLASGEWPHLSLPLGLYLAKEYPEAQVDSVEGAEDLIRHSEHEQEQETNAFMAGC